MKSDDFMAVGALAAMIVILVAVGSVVSAIIDWFGA